MDFEVKFKCTLSKTLKRLIQLSWGMKKVQIMRSPNQQKCKNGDLYPCWQDWNHLSFISKGISVMIPRIPATWGGPQKWRFATKFCRIEHFFGSSIKWTNFHFIFEHFLNTIPTVPFVKSASSRVCKHCRKLTLQSHLQCDTRVQWPTNISQQWCFFFFPGENSLWEATFSAQEAVLTFKLFRA